MYPLKGILLSFLPFSLGIVLANHLSRDTGKALLTISTKVSATGVGNIAEKDRARVRFLKYGSSSNDSVLNVSNSLLIYTAHVGVGTPPTYFDLMVDTGSSNTWVGASQPYTPTNSSVNTGGSVYGSGVMSGEEWFDSVTLTPDLVISQQSIGVASSAPDFDGVDGVLGLGPVGLTQNTTSYAFQVPTVPDNLYAQKKIPQEALGIFFAPASESNDSGTITFGGYDDSVITSSINYVQLASSHPADNYWAINQSISYGDTVIQVSTVGVVDTGTTLILIASDAFQNYVSSTGAILDPTTGLLTITSAQYTNLQTLWFNIGGTPYGLTPNAQIWPRSLNTIIGGASSAIYLVVNDIGFLSGTGIDLIIGYSFLQRFYSIYDTTDKRFGIAQTIYTNSTTN